MFIRPSGPCSLKRITQSRSVWRSIPPVFAASSRDAPSRIAATARSRRACAAFGLGRPGAVGAQNDLRYAVFPETRRLVLDDHGAISIYDTGSHRIFGVAQAQWGDQTLSFTSQDGLVRVADLRKLHE
jgi:hypothetical protein